MREPKEIAKDLEAIHNEMNKWLQHLGRESAKVQWDKLVKKEIELEREFDKSFEEKYEIK
jgi:hypothetical protein